MTAAGLELWWSLRGGRRMILALVASLAAAGAEEMRVRLAVGRVDELRARRVHGGAL